MISLMKMSIRGSLDSMKGIHKGSTTFLKSQKRSNIIMGLVFEKQEALCLFFK